MFRCPSSASRSFRYGFILIYVFCLILYSEPFRRHTDFYSQDDGCGIHYGRNLVEIRRSVDVSQLMTRLYMEGGTDAHGDPVRVGAINGGLDYIDADTIGRWGIRCGIWTDSSVEDPETLLACGRALLEARKNPVYSYQATALDLHRLTGQDWDNLMPGKKVRVMDDLHGVLFSARIVRIEKADVYGDPGGITVTIASQPRDQVAVTSALTEKVAKMDRSVGGWGGQIRKSREAVDDLTGRMVTAETALEIGEDGISMMSRKFSALYDDYAQILLKGGSIGLLASHMEDVEGWITGTEASLEIYGDRVETRVLTVEDRLTTAESAIEQYADEIDLYVKKGELNSSITLSGDGVDISGGRITLTGYTTMTEFEALKGSVDGLLAGTLMATGLVANGGSFGSLTASTYASLHGVFVENVTCSPHTLTIGTKTATFFGPSDATFELSDMPGYDDAMAAARTDGASSVEVTSCTVSTVGPDRVATIVLSNGHVSAFEV